MRFSAYILLIFCISMSLYFIGYDNIISHFQEKGHSPIILNCQEDDPFCNDNTVIIGSIIATIGLATAIATLVSGYSAIYILPIILLLGILNFVVFPLDFLMSIEDPLIRFPVLGLFNLLLIISFLDFVRGNA